MKTHFRLNDIFPNARIEIKLEIKSPISENIIKSIRKETEKILINLSIDDWLQGGYPNSSEPGEDLNEIYGGYMYPLEMFFIEMINDRKLNCVKYICDDRNNTIREMENGMFHFEIQFKQKNSFITTKLLYTISPLQ